MFQHEDITTFLLCAMLLYMAQPSSTFCLITKLGFFLPPLLCCFSSFAHASDPNSTFDTILINPDNRGCKEVTMGDCYNKIEINSPITEVWKTINNFHDMSWAGNVVINVSKVGDKEGTEIGARRVLNGIIHETLTNFDPDEFTFSYRIDQGVGPISSFVSNYNVVVNLTSIEGGTIVEWRSSFESENDNDTAGFLNPIYSSMLKALKKTLS